MKFILAILALAAVAYCSKHDRNKIIGSYDDMSEVINVKNVNVKERGHGGYGSGYAHPRYDYGSRYNIDDGYERDDFYGSGGSNDASAYALDDGYNGNDGYGEYSGYGGYNGGYNGGYGNGGYGRDYNDRDNNRNRNRNRNANANANANRDENQNRNRNNVKSKNAVEDTINVSLYETRFSLKREINNLFFQIDSKPK